MNFLRKGSRTLADSGEQRTTTVETGRSIDSGDSPGSAKKRPEYGRGRLRRAKSFDEEKEKATRKRRCNVDNKHSRTGSTSGDSSGILARAMSPTMSLPTSQDQGSELPDEGLDDGDAFVDANGAAAGQMVPASSEDLDAGERSGSASRNGSRVSERKGTQERRKVSLTSKRSGSRTNERTGSRTNDRRPRSRGQDRKGSKAGLGSRKGSRDQKQGTNLSASSSKQSDWQSDIVFGDDDDGESSSSGDGLYELGQDWSNVDINRMPLHLRQGNLRATASDVLHTPATPPKQIRGLVRSNSEMEGEEGDEEDENNDLPYISVPVKRMNLFSGTCCFIIWVLCADFLMVINVWRYSTTLRQEAQRIAVDTALLRAEATVHTHLAPALEVVRSVALAARAGYFNQSLGLPVYDVITAVTAPLMVASPALATVAYSGVSKQVLLVRRGNLMDEDTTEEQRLPMIYTLESCQLSPLACLALNGSRVVPAPDYGAALGWQYLEFSRVDALGQPLDGDKWVLTHHLGAHMDLGSSDFPSAPMAVDVTISLNALSKAMKEVAPSGGEVFVTTEDGTLLAGSAWNPVATSDTLGQVVYQGIWDVGRPWADIASKALLDKAAANPDGRAEEVFGLADVVAVGSLQVGCEGSGARLAARSALRVVVYSPFSKAMLEVWTPLVAAALVLVAVSVLVACCLVCMCSWRHCRIEAAEARMQRRYMARKAWQMDDEDDDNLW